jgi:hypothetical protein
MISNDGDYYCLQCFNSYYFCCLRCNSIYKKELLTIINYNCVCHNCSINYTECGECGNLYDEYNGDCPNCSNYSDNIRDHYFKPKPIFYYNRGKTIKFSHNNRKLYFGFELEVDNNNEDQNDSDNVAYSLLKEVNKDKEFIYCKEDGSLNNGFEIVSHPFSFEWLCKNNSILDPIFNTLINKGYRSYKTRTCGMHVHMSKNGFSNLLLFKFLKFIYNNKSFSKFISRRSESNLNNWCTLDEKIHKLSLINCAKIKTSIGYRNTAINLLPTNTIEIRLFRGTLNKFAFLRNIEFLHSLYKFCSEESINKLEVNNYINYVNSQEDNYINIKKFLSEKNDEMKNLDIIKENEC